MVNLAEGAEAVKEFLDSCEVSGNQAYANFKDILESLQEEQTRIQARRFIAAVERYVTEECPGINCLEKYHFRLHDLALSDVEDTDAPTSPRSGPRSPPGGGKRQTLQLLELPSIFIPEAWSFTFFEGLSRHPETGFRDRDVVELGTGNGWISLALAERWCPRKVIGLDINPRAIKVAWINLFLNAFSREGVPVGDRDGKTLLDRVEFHVSDLLEHCLTHKIQVDRVIGCIPQVLNPDPEAMLKKVSEQASEDFLYDLSNYCGLQGFVEDQFGLGLIARALEESIEVVKSTGAVILNMGGRPGQAVCERLYERRGFNIKKLWQTRVNQAADTDILALVEIERNSRHRFEFYMGQVCEEPISARTAWAYARAGGSIAHGLSVYEARLRQPNQVKTIFQFLRKEGYQDTRSALDLAFTSEAVADEKISFLANLAKALTTTECFPYEVPAGNDWFRIQIARFLRLYFKIPVSTQNIVVTPSRSVTIENILRLYSPALALVGTSFARWLPKKWTNALPQVGDKPVPGAASPGAEPVVLEVPHRADLVVPLVKHLKPQILVTSLADFEMRTSTAFEQLLIATAEVGTRLFLDISDYVELSSQPSTNGVLAFLATNPLPVHAALICGLVKNQVYSDLQVCFVISESADVLRALVGSGELTYNRTAAINQLYYGCLIHELLSFQIPDRHQMVEREPKEESQTEASKFISLTESTVSAFQHPTVSAIRCPLKDGTVRMDCTENDLPTPEVVKHLIFEGFARQNISDTEQDPRPDILALFQQRFGLIPEKTHDVMLGDGAASLFARLMHACADEGGTLLIPSGAGGHIIATAAFFRVKTQTVPTTQGQLFKLTEDALSEALGKVTRPWLALCAPVVNPTGAVYSEAEVKNILGLCRNHGARVVLDTCFCGLEFAASSGGGVIRWDLEESLDLPATEAGPSPYTVVVMGGISKEFSAGGLRFGYAVFRDAGLAEAMRDGSLTRPHGTLKYTVKKTLALRNSADPALVSALADHTAVLFSRGSALAEALKNFGWEPLTPQGGLFLVAKPTAYIGKKLTYTKPSGESATVELDSVNIADALFATTGLVINSSAWTGIPGFCQFVLSIEQESFDHALKLLRDFHSLVLSPPATPPQ